MQNYSIIVSFDLEKAPVEGYRAAREELTKLGFADFIRDDQSGRVVHLTNTTWIAEATGSDAAALRDSVRMRIEAAFQRRGLKGKLLVEVGSDWACSVSPFNGIPTRQATLPPFLGFTPSLPRPAVSRPTALADLLNIGGYPRR